MKKTFLVAVLLVLCFVAMSACRSDLGTQSTLGSEQPTVQESFGYTEPTSQESSEAPTQQPDHNTEPTIDQTEATCGEATECQHVFGEWVITKQANCKEVGERTRTCGNCAAVEKDVVAKSDTHTPVTDAAVPASCKNTGLTEGSHCSVCNKVLAAQTTVPVTDVHTPVTDAAVPATCKDAGLTEGSHCSVCSKVLVVQNATPKTEHSYVDNLCTCGAYQESEGLAFTKSGSAYTLAGIGTCQDARIVVPATYNGLPVKYVAADAFKSVNSFYEIVLPSSITSIGARAFSCCKGLKTIMIPDGVKYLEVDTFEECIALVTVKLPAELLQIMERCFVGCTSLKNIELPQKLIKIRESAFMACTKLEKISLPSSLNEIQQFAFYDCTSLSIRYLGMQWQFKQLSKGFEWCGNIWNNVITCYDGDCDFYGNPVKW